MTTRQASTPLAASPAAVIPVLALGFRPFYLAAALFAAVAVPLWIASHAGALSFPGYLVGAAWHSHEMVFGFAPAVIAGFLFTATRNWTGLPTPTGPLLAALVALWVAARVLVLTGPDYPALVIDVLFLPALAIAVGVPILRSRRHRNLIIIAVVVALGAANLLFHLAWIGALPTIGPQAATGLALDGITILMAVMAGRVVPMFTANAVPSAKPRRVVPIEVAAIGLLVLVFLFDLVAMWTGPAETLLAGLLVAAAIVHAVRLALWAPLATRSQPLLWFLPLAYAWIPAALALRAASLVFVEVPPVLSQHALAVGAMAGLMLAMMSRSALGHTGRALIAGPAETAAFLLVQAAVLLRVVPEMVRHDPGPVPLYLSATCWSAAFLIWAVRYWPILTRPRIDGKPG